MGCASGCFDRPELFLCDICHAEVICEAAHALGGLNSPRSVLSVEKVLGGQRAVALGHKVKDYYFGGSDGD